MEPFGLPKWITTLLLVIGVLVIVPIVYFIIFIVFLMTDTASA